MRLDVEHFVFTLSSNRTVGYAAPGKYLGLILRKYSGLFWSFPLGIWRMTRRLMQDT